MHLPAYIYNSPPKKNTFIHLIGDKHFFFFFDCHSLATILPFMPKILWKSAVFKCRFFYYFIYQKHGVARDYGGPRRMINRSKTTSSSSVLITYASVCNHNYLSDPLQLLKLINKYGSFILTKICCILFNYLNSLCNNKKTHMSSAERSSPTLRNSAFRTPARVPP